MSGVETFQAVDAQTQYTQSRQDAVRLELIKGVVVCTGQQARKLAKVVGELVQESGIARGSIAAESAIKSTSCGAVGEGRRRRDFIPDASDPLEHSLSTHQDSKQPRKANGTARLYAGSGFGLHLVPQVLTFRKRGEKMEQCHAEDRREGDTDVTTRGYETVGYKGVLRV